MEPGSTVLLAYVTMDHPSRCWVANLGDSRAAWIGHDGQSRQTVDHNVVTNPQDRQTILQRGKGHIGFDGRYVILEPAGLGLNVSRGIGDAPWANILIRTPDLYQFELSPGTPLLLASDGLWNTLECPMEEIVRCAARTQARPLVETLLSKGALTPQAGGWRGGGRDNVSLIIYRPMKMLS